MINVETIKFVKMLDDLAGKSSIGIEPFSAVSSYNYFDKVVCYDDRNTDEDGNYRLILQSVIDECHHNIMAYIEDTLDYKVRVHCSRKDGDYIEVVLPDSDTSIVIEDGRWYFA